MWQASGEAPRRSRSGLQADRGTRGGLLIIRLALFGFVIAKRLDRGRYGPRAILRERFARQNNIVFSAFHGSAGSTIIRRTPIVQTPAIVAVALRRSIFRGRQIAPAALSVRTPIAIPVATAAAAAAATPSKSSAPSAASAISTTVAAAIPAAVVALRAIVADARRIIAGRVVTGREILRRGSVRFRLALVKVAAFGRLAVRAAVTFVMFGLAVKFFR